MTFVFRFVETNRVGSTTDNIRVRAAKAFSNAVSGAILPTRVGEAETALLINIIGTSANTAD